MNEINVLIVEDDAVIAEKLEMFLKRHGYTIKGSVRNGHDAVQLVKNGGIDIVLMDITIEGELDGIETAEIIQKRFFIPVIFLTAHTDETYIERARVTKPYGYLLKPLNLNDVVNTIQIALYSHLKEEEVRRHRKLLQSIIDGIAHPIMVIGSDYKIQILNKAAGKYVDEDDNELYCYKVSHKRDTPCHEENFACSVDEVFKGGNVVNVMHEHILPDGTVRHHEIIASPLFDSNGNVTAVIESSHDVTERIKIEKALKKQREKFISVLVHDLKGPLIPIIGFTKRLMKGKAATEEKLRETLGIISSAAQDLYSSIESISESLKNQDVEDDKDFGIMDLNHLVCSIVENFRPQAQLKGLRFINKACIEEDIDEYRIHGSPQLIKTMVENLIGNALKYAKTLISVELRQTDRYVLFVISDDGKGIAECYHEDIFKDYFQIPGSLKGTGIGLYSVKQVVERHKGTIKVISSEGAGACFEVKFPLNEKRHN